MNQEKKALQNDDHSILYIVQIVSPSQSKKTNHNSHSVHDWKVQGRKTHTVKLEVIQVSVAAGQSDLIPAIVQVLNPLVQLSDLNYQEGEVEDDEQGQNASEDSVEDNGEGRILRDTSKLEADEGAHPGEEGEDEAVPGRTNLSLQIPKFLRLQAHLKYFHQNAPYQEHQHEHYLPRQVEENHIRQLILFQDGNGVGVRLCWSHPHPDQVENVPFAVKGLFVELAQEVLAVGKEPYHHEGFCEGEERHEGVEGISEGNDQHQRANQAEHLDKDMEPIPHKLVVSRINQQPRSSDDLSMLKSVGIIFSQWWAVVAARGGLDGIMFGEMILPVGGLEHLVPDD